MAMQAEVSRSTSDNTDNDKGTPQPSIKSSSSLRKPASVFNESTFFGRLASSKEFEYATLTVISLNALWLGLDTDVNHATSFHDTALFFIIVENLFCAYFTVEIIVRFIAFRHKIQCFSDRWFVFDSLLVLLMIAETWVMPFALKKGQSSPLGDLGALRLLRLLRLSRLIRIMRAVPELLTIVKGLAAAVRSVASVLLFLTILVYVFAIVFTGTYQKDPDAPDNPDACEEWGEEGGGELAHKCLSEEFFGNLGISMFTLLCNGTLLDDVAGLVKAIREHSVIMLVLFFLFITLSSFTLLNMLIGILCERVERTQGDEAEKARRETVTGVITQAFEAIDTDGSQKISQKEFDEMCQDGEVLKTIEEELGIDASQMIEMKDLIFTDIHGKRELTFDNFLKVLIRLRPEEQASSMDVQQFRKVIRDHERSTRSYIEKLKGQVETCRAIATGARGVGRVGANLGGPLSKGDQAGGGSACVADAASGSFDAERSFAQLVAEATDTELMQEFRRRFRLTQQTDDPFRAVATDQLTVATVY